MRYSIGYDGWALFELDDPRDLLLYVRMARNSRGRYVVREMYLDTTEAADDVPITGSELANLPLDLVEALLNESEEVAELERKRRAGWTVPIGVLASFYATTINPARFDRFGWIGEQRRADLGDKAVTRQGRGPRDEDWQPPQDRLEALPADGLTDEFLARVARAYSAAVARGESPNRTIADDVGAPVKTVQRWVYTARQRGIMPAGRRGAVG